MNLLLDENVSPTLARMLSTRQKGLYAVALRDWRDGAFLNRSDEEILRQAMAEKLILVTFDVNSIPPLLVRLAMAGEDHGGVILISSGSFAQKNLGAQARALVATAHLAGPWLNRVVFLRAKGKGEEVRDQ